MTAATLREVRAEVAAAVSTEIVCYDRLPTSPIPPFAVVMWPDRVEFSRTLSGRSEYYLRLTLYVGLTDPEAAQDALDAYISGPIRAAIESRSSAVWKSALVDAAENFRAEALDSTAALAADITLTVIA